MLMQADNEAIASGGLGQGNAFTIASNAKVFSILSGQIYQNAILAVIREISCNAADAHKLVGKDLSSIEVHLPTFGEPYFSVRDCGPGLSRDDVLNLYTTYFQSTKDGNNDLIGGFGLGSKSPFAIADQFTVTSWHSGQKITYVCYKQDGVPTINIIDEQPTDEPTGLEVRVASSARPATWLNEASRYYRWWPVQPKTNAALDTISIFDPANVLLQSTDVSPAGVPDWYLVPNLSRPQVFMGLVPYELNLSAIPNLPEEVTTALSSLGLIFMLNVGDVSINPSRETLSYDPKTCAVLMARLKSLYAKLTADITASLDKLPTLYEARQFLYDKSNGPLSGSNSLADSVRTLLERGRLSLRWRGQPVKRDISVDTAMFGAPPLLSMTRYSKPGYTTRYQTLNFGTSSWTDNLGASRTYVWTPSITSKTYATLRHDASQRSYYRHDYSILAGGTFADVAAAATKLGLPPVVDVTTMPVPPSAARGSRSFSPTVRAYVAGDREFARSETAVDLKGGGYYCEFFQGRPVGMQLSEFNFMRDAGFIPADSRLVGFQQRRFESKRFALSLALNGWQKFDYQAMLDALPAATVEDYYYRQGMVTLGDRAWGASFFKTKPALTNQAFASLCAEYLSVVPPAPLYGRSFDFTNAALAAARQGGKNRAAIYYVRLANAVATKPLLKYVNGPGGPANAEYHAHLLAYINS